MTVTIATRQYQLVPLTHEQVDTNFINLADAVNVNGASISALGQDGGSALIGNGGESVAASLNALQLTDYAALRTYTGPRKSVYVTGHLVTVRTPGISGVFARDDSDTTSTDNGGTIIVSSTGVRWKRQSISTVLIDWFGAIGDGATDDTVSCDSAITFSSNNALQLSGSTGARYKITSTIDVPQGNFVFNGNNCEFVNGVIEDPLFGFQNVNISGVRFSNFRISGLGNNGHVFSVIGSLSTGPQFITFENVWITSNSGNGKDYLGNSIPAQMLYAYGAMTIRVKNCVSYQSGGIRAQNTLKLHISDTTIDNPIFDRLVYLKGCNDVLIDGDCIFNGGTTDQVDIESCENVRVLLNRLKGGSGRQIYAHGGSSNIALLYNQHENFNLATSVVEITTAVLNPCLHGSSYTYVNNTSDGSLVTFAKPCISLLDEIGGGFISFGAVISQQSFNVNNNMSIPGFISAGSTLNSIRGLRLESNCLASASAVTGVTIDKGIDLNGNLIGTIVQRNQYGAPPGATMGTGISVGANCVGTDLIENSNNGNTTAPIVDLSPINAGTRRREGGVLVPNSYTPAISGTTTPGVGTYSSQVGSYKLDGKLSPIGINLAWTSHTGTGSAMTVNLPFTCANRIQVLNVLADGLTYSGQLVAAVSAGDNKIRLWSQTSGGALSQIAFDAAATLYISGVLEIA